MAARLLRHAHGPASFAWRRLRARPGATLALFAALVAGGALIGWGSLAAALAQEQNVKLQVGELTPKYRAFSVLYYSEPLQRDTRARGVAGVMQSFDDVARDVRRIRIWHSIDPNDAAGPRIVVTRTPRRDVAVERGRLPHACTRRVCETLVLKGKLAIGARLALGRGRTAVVVGTGSLSSRLLPDTTQLGPLALLMEHPQRALSRALDAAGSTVVYSSVIDPRAVRGFELDRLRARFRAAIARLERGDPLVHVAVPLALLDTLAERGRVTRARLLLVAGQGAALVIAFAVFVARARRRERRIADGQLETFGATRAQLLIARVVEVAVPAVVAVAVTVVGVWLAARVAAARKGYPGAFVHEVLSLQTTLVIVVVGLLATILLVTAAREPSRPRFGFGALELAALASLAIIGWQATVTGALDPQRIADGGGGPVVLIAPALAFFAAGVLLLRVVPIALRTAERVTRNLPGSGRIAFLSAARRPADAAAATTFLAVALGSALFSLDYRATLDAQAHAQAAFTAGSSWRVLERGGGGQGDVTPLTRFRAVTSEPPTPVVRADADASESYPPGALLRVKLLAVPAARLPRVGGWERDFSASPPQALVRRLRPRPVRLQGLRIDTRARAVRAWVRAQADHPRSVVLHFLLPGQRFESLRLGIVWKRWRRLTAPLPASLRGAQLVSVEYAPTYVPIDFKYDPRGWVGMGRIEQRSASGWRTLPSIADWQEARAPDGTAGILVPWRFTKAPVRVGTRFDLNGTFRPLVHPPLPLPTPPPGFSVPTLPALVSAPLAAQAVDGIVAVSVLGRSVPLRVVGSSSFFPTIVSRPDRFAVLDYDTLFAALNSDQPGLVRPSEAWFFAAEPPAAVARLQSRPFRLDRVVSFEGTEARLTHDPLAAGTRSVLGISALVSALLALAGLVIAMRSQLATERLQLAEYETLGITPRSLRRSTRTRLVLTAAAGVAAGVAGGLLSLRLVTAFVAVTAASTEPVPPITANAAWAAAGAVVVALAAGGAVAATILTRRALRGPTARRLRA